MAVELDQLDPAERSPVSAIEDVERGAAIRRGLDGVHSPVLVDQRVGRERIAHRERELVARQVNLRLAIQWMDALTAASIAANLDYVRAAIQD